MKLFLSCNLSNEYLIALIIPETLRCSGSTDDYPYDNLKSFCYMSFVPEEGTDINVLYSELISKCYESQREHITIKTDFSEYELDKRPRIIIKFRNGIRGLTSPYSFHFKA